MQGRMLGDEVMVDDGVVMGSLLGCKVVLGLGGLSIELLISSLLYQGFPKISDAGRRAGFAIGSWFLESIHKPDLGLSRLTGWS